MVKYIIQGIQSQFRRNMIKGTYIFYADGKEIARHANVITKFGKRFLTNFIAGNEKTLSKSMAFGIDSTTATELDTRLGFEFYRTPVQFGSTDIQTENETTTYSVVYKATIPQDVSGLISEVGIYPEVRKSLNIFDSKFITDFDSQLDWTNAPELATANSKVGPYLLNMVSNNNAAREYTSNISLLDLSGYSVNDSIRLAYYKYDDNLASIKIRLYSSATAYYETTITPPSGTGHFISSNILLSSVLSGATSPAPDSKNINKLGIVLTPTSGNTTSVGMDALRINDEDTFDPQFGLISRSVVTALSKVAGRQVDVEYRLDLGF
jgi:hypothetical protein